jgi:two-component system sensor histidine kinase DegS
MSQIKEENKVWESKVKEAIELFSIMQNELESSIACVSDKIDHMELHVIELTKTLEVVNQTSDINLSLFSPYQNTHKITETKRLQTDLQEINENLPKLINELQVLQDKRVKTNLIRECLEYLQTLVEEDPLSVKNQNSSALFTKGIFGNNLTEIDIDNNGVKILETQELERQRIARDLHDSIIQNLTNLVHKTELCLKLFDIDVIRAKLEMASMIEAVRFIINNMREIIYNLRPMTIHDLGLVPTIELYVKNYMQQNHIQVQLLCQEEKRNLLPVINLSLYRIIQEACNNISKYAQATISKITLNYESSYVELIIEDNGKGIEEKAKERIDKENGGFGLSIMRERALLLSGSFKIESYKGKGTKIIVTVPYRENKGE